MSYFKDFTASWFIVKKVLFLNGFTQLTDNKGDNGYVYFSKKLDKKDTIHVQVARSRRLSYPYLVELANQSKINQEIFLGQISVLRNSS